MPTHSLQAINPFFYYTDLDAATLFYTETLGLELVADLGSARTVRTSPASFLTVADMAHSPHKNDAAKAVTLAFVTQEVEAWFAYVQSREIPVRHPLRSDRSKPHEGFVALDPEGYFLEFERFNPHPENERLLPRLAQIAPLSTKTPGQLPLSATVLWLYYQQMTVAQRFLSERLGLALLVDQGFATVYAVGDSSFIGPVVAGEGLHGYAPEKLVTVTLCPDDLAGWRTSPQSAFPDRLQLSFWSDPEGYLWGDQR